MRKRIILVNVADPWLRNGGDRPSLGTLYLASWLRQTNSAESSVIDLNHYGDNGLLQRIKEFQPDVIGISLTTPQYEEAVRIAKIIKENYSIPIIAGGPHVTAMQNVKSIPEIMPQEFDFCVLGDGEKTLEKICREGLPNQRIVKGETTPLKSIDWLPLPARDLVDMEKYELKILGKRAQPIMTSFGCPYHCTFCSEPILNNRFKAHSPERVIQEMRELKERYGAEALMIYDDVYSIDSKRVIAIADLMIKEGLNLDYRATTRATDFLRYPQLADKLKESGCVEICIGLESADDNILRTNDKGMSVEQNRKGIEAIKKTGMRCLTYMITGLPGSNRETEENSLRFVQEVEADETGWYMLAPFPSTPLWVHRERYGVKIYEQEIIRNKWDVAQCRADNENLTCYIDYTDSGGMSRQEIKSIWLEMRDRMDKWQKERGQRGIQYSDIDLMESVK